MFFFAGAFLLWVRGRVFFFCCGCGGAFFFFCCGCGGRVFFFAAGAGARFFFVAGAVGAPFFLLRVRSVFAVFSIFYYENLYFL